MSIRDQGRWVPSPAMFAVCAVSCALLTQLAWAQTAPSTVFVPGDARTLAEAVELVADGGTIYLTADLEEAIVLETDKTLQIVGVPAGYPPGEPCDPVPGDCGRSEICPPRPTWCALPSIGAPPGAEAAVSLVDSPSVTVENLAIRGAPVGVRIDGEGTTQLRGLSLQDNEIGVEVTGRGTVALESCDFWDNLKVGLKVSEAQVELLYTRFAGNHHAVLADDVPGFSMEQSIVAHSLGEVGVMVSDADTVDVASTFFWQNGGFAALAVGDAGAVFVSDSTFNQNTTAALHVWDSQDVDVADVLMIGTHDPLAGMPEWDAPDPSKTGGRPVTGLGTMHVTSSAPADVPAEYDPYLGSGVVVQDVTETWVAYVTSTHNAGAGVLLKDSQLVNVFIATLHSNGMTGLAAADCTDTWIYDVYAHNNVWAGLLISGGSALIEDSELHANYPTPPPDERGGYGIQVQDGGSHVIRDTQMLVNYLASLSVYGPGDYVALYDTFMNGSPFAVQKSAGTVIDWHAGNIYFCTNYPTEPERCIFHGGGTPAPAPAPLIPEVP